MGIPASPRAHRASSASPRVSPRGLPSGPKATRGSDKPRTPRKDPKSFSEARKIESGSLLDLGNRCRKASRILTTPKAQAAPRKLIASEKTEEFQHRKKRKTDW